ncbi:MAG: hypothetical protein AAB375_03295 [Patescibacteria group bacterium]
MLRPTSPFDLFDRVSMNFKVRVETIPSGRCRTIVSTLFKRIPPYVAIEIDNIH